MASPVAAAKTIRDIGIYLPVNPFIREEHRMAVEAWHAWSNGELPPTVRAPHLFGNAFLDSYVLDLVVTQDAPVSHFGPAVPSRWYDVRAHFHQPGRARLWWDVDALRDFLATRLTDRGLSPADFLSS